MSTEKLRGEPVRGNLGAAHFLAEVAGHLGCNAQAALYDGGADPLIVL
jgi:hypothetical protein